MDISKQKKILIVNKGNLGCDKIFLNSKTAKSVNHSPCILNIALASK